MTDERVPGDETEPRPLGDSLVGLASRLAGVRARQPEPLRAPLPPVESIEERRLREAEERRRQSDRREERWRSTVPARFVDAEVGKLTGKVGAAVEKWLGLGAPRPNLVLFGPEGTGKTYAAMAAARALLVDEGTEAMWASVVDFLDRLRPDGDEGAYAAAAKAGVLLLDDLGREKRSDWTDERLFMLFDERWSWLRPTIATSNLEPEALREHLGDAAFARLCKSGAVIVALTGESRRKGS